MPQFRFRVLTPDGRVRSGRFTGNSVEEARKQIEDSGLNVLELTPVESEGPLASIPLPRAPGWMARISGYWVAAALLCAGLAWGIWSWRQARLHPPPPGRARGALEMANQRFQGEFRLRASGVPPQAVVVVHFPEIPYQVTHPWSRAQEGCKVDFQAARTPGYCLLRLQDGAKVLGETRVEPLLPSNEVQLHIR
ncbi:hypothetical protein ABS71_20445 [bacterium SCN 62-11]|nr:hypothetical protein [Candidatus Eremiobacteraeota bacterium]ODT57207.1 MAG: hypothetical protein ABS71_20445 [bacterium SCN 62-11]